MAKKDPRRNGNSDQQRASPESSALAQPAAAAAPHPIAAVVDALTKAADSFTTYRVMEFDPRLEPIKEESHRRRAAFQMAKEVFIVQVGDHMAAAIKACGQAVDELDTRTPLPGLSAEASTTELGPVEFVESSEQFAPAVFTPGADYRPLAGMPDELEQRFCDLMEERLPPQLAQQFIDVFYTALQRDFKGLERATGEIGKLLNATVGGSRRAVDS